MSALREQFDSLNDRLQQMPRAVRWAVYAAVGILLFLVWDETLGPLHRSWSASADRIEQNVQRLHSADFAGDVRQLRAAIQSLGPVNLPGGERQTKEAIAQIVNETIGSYRSVSNASFSLHGRGALPKNAVTELTRGEQRIGRIVGDLRFDADPHDAFEIIAQLESHPEIELINNINIQRQPQQRLNVRMEIESWVLSRDTSNAGRRGGQI